MRFIDYHIHTNHSQDAERSCTLNKAIEAAILHGIEEICITDHYEPNGFTCVPDLVKFFEDYNKAEYLYHDKITMRAGIELGNPWECPEHCHEIINSLPFDFVLGSVHNIPECFTKIDFTKVDRKDFMKRYFECIHKLLDFGNFDVLAHIDLPKRYFHMAGLSWDIYEENLAELNEVLLRLLEMDKGLEVNLSGLRSTLGKPMPDVNVLKMWHHIGGRKITVGSDSHASDDVGKFVEDGLDLIAECGFYNIATFEKREVIFQPIEFKEYV